MVYSLWFMVISCAGMVEKETAPMQAGGVKTAPPEVTGEVRLVFTGTFGETAGIRSPWGISFGVDGTLYVCDRDRSAIVRLDREGNSLSRFSGFGSRVERLYSPIDICSSAGMAIYAVDAANSRVLRFDRNLKNSFVIYKKDSAENRLFGTFNGLAFDKASGDLYVTDRDTGALIRIDMLGGSIKNRGAFGSGKDSFREPAGLDVAENGAIYIADRGAGAVAVLNHFGAQIRRLGSDVLEAPVDVAALPDGCIAVADLRGVIVLSETGVPVGRTGYDVDREMSPRSVAFSDGRLYVSDSVTASILVYEVK
jgi:DNA-binding beta-propeller fold protein YncE